MPIGWESVKGVLWQNDLQLGVPPELLDLMENPLIIREARKTKNFQEFSKGTFYNCRFPILKTLMDNCPWLHPVVKISYPLNFRRPDSTSTLSHENKMCDFITLSGLCFSLLNCASALTADEWARISPLPHISVHLQHLKNTLRTLNGRAIGRPRK